MPADVTDVLLDLARAFEAEHVRWYVFGAQAVIAAGVPRLTADVDVTAEVSSGGPVRLVAALERCGFDLRDVGDVATFVAETRVIPVVHRRSDVPVDVVLAGPGLEEEMLARVRQRRVRGVSIPFVSTPDLVALKLLAGRSKDLEDVRALIRASPPDLVIDEARRRVRDLAALLDDSTMLQTFETIVAGAPKTAPKRKAVKKAKRKP